MKPFRLIAAVASASLVITACGGTTDEGSSDDTFDASTSEPESDPEPRHGDPPDAAPESTAPAPEDVSRGSVLQSNLIPPSAQGSGTIDIQEYLNFVVTNLDQVWTQWFVSQGWTEPFVNVVYIGAPDTPVWETDCGGVVFDTNLQNAIYCGLDGDGSSYAYQGYSTDQDQGALLLPLQSLTDFYNTGQIARRQTAVVGDFAAAFLVAHEFGHSVEDEIARQYNLLQWLNGGAWVQSPVGKWKELIADCFAGVWAYSVSSQQMLEEGDLEEGLAAAAAAGDVNPPGTFSRDPHGQPEERYNAFLSGFQTGDPAQCISGYWQQDPAADKDQNNVPDVNQQVTYPYPAGFPVPADWFK